MKLKTFLSSLVVVVLLTSCEDLFEDGSLQPDGSTPHLTLKNPTKNQTLTKTGGLRVKLTATDKDKVKELQVRVRDIGGDADLINYTTFPDKRVLEVDTLLAVSDFRAGEYTLTIQATDFRTNVASQEVTFKVK